MGTGDGTVLDHDDLLVGTGLSGGHRLAQIVETLTTHCEVSGITGHKHRLNSSVRTYRQGDGGVVGHIGAGGFVIPAVEGITAVGGGRQRIGTIGSVLGIAGFGGDGGAVHLIAAVFRSRKGGGHVAAAHQLNIGDGQGVGAGAAGGGQGDDQGAAGGQLAAVRITGNTGHRAAATQRIAEGQGAGVGIVVCNGQFGGNGTADNT